jgi:tripartite-type tricarboxylate transporter receptor subunit TctC
MIMAPPGTPADRVAILRRAFDAMVKDPGFVEESRKIGILVDPMSGEDLAGLVNRISTAPASVVEKLREVTRPQ